MTRVVDVYATVKDAQGRLVTSLGRDRFELREDGVRQQEMKARYRRLSGTVRREPASAMLPPVFRSDSKDPSRLAAQTLWTQRSV